MNTLTREEVTVTQMALSSMIQDLEASGKDPAHPFTPEARKAINEMLASGRSALQKFASASGKLVQLDPFKPGDEKEFFTKES